jgi:hypothetical protein
VTSSIETSCLTSRTKTNDTINITTDLRLHFYHPKFFLNIEPNGPIFKI